MVINLVGMRKMCGRYRELLRVVLDFVGDEGGEVPWIVEEVGRLDLLDKQLIRTMSRTGEIAALKKVGRRALERGEGLY